MTHTCLDCGRPYDSTEQRPDLCVTCRTLMFPPSLDPDAETRQERKRDRRWPLPRVRR
jgi:hypothetical protein